MLATISLSMTSNAPHITANIPTVNFENPFAAFTMKLEELPPGENAVTRYIDKSLEIVKERGWELLNEESETWIGKIFDRVFGLGKKKQSAQDSLAIKTSEQTAIAVDNLRPRLSEKRSLKKTEELAESNLQANAQLDSDGSAYIFAKHYFYDCLLDGGTRYNQFFEVVLSNWGEVSNDPQQFKISYPNCILQRVLNQYIHEVEALPSAQACQLNILGGRQIYQWVASPETTYYLSGENPEALFTDQQNVSFSEGLTASCYFANLVQEMPPEETFVIDGHLFGGNHLSGHTNIRYSDYYCERGYRNENWELFLPSFDMPSLWFPFLQVFEFSYAKCSEDSVKEYFQLVEGDSAICRSSEFALHTLNYTLGTDGTFLVSSSIGTLLPWQVGIEFPVEIIKECFDKHYPRYKIAENVFYKCAFVVGLLVVGGVLSHQLHKRKFCIHQKSNTRTESPEVNTENP